MRISKAKTLLAGLVLVMMMGLAGCGKKEDLSEVRVAYFPNITHTQALVMKDKGTFEKAIGDDVNVKWTAFNAGPAEIEAFFAGEIDLGYIGPVPAINGYTQSKGDLQIIAGATDGGAVLVTRKDLVLKDISELSGLTVAIPQLGNTQHLNLLNLLKENGLETTDNSGTVKVTSVANSDVKTLMDAGEVDAALVPEPWGSILQNDIGANVFLDWKDVWRDGDYSTAVVVCNKDFLEAHPDIVEKFVQAHLDTTDYINSNLSEAEDIVNKQIEAETQKSFDKGILDSAFARLNISADISKDSISEFAKIYKDQGFIEELPGDDLINSSILDKLQK